MSGYLFFPAADARLDEIWKYTEKKHGEQQAATYIIGLFEHLQELFEEKIEWKILPQKWIVPADLDVDIFFSKYDYHFIFFRKLPSGKIGIMSILHEVMNIPVRLKDDLIQINRGRAAQ